MAEFVNIFAFITAFAADLCTRASVTTEGNQRTLWVGSSDELLSHPDAYSVLRQYDGGTGWIPTNKLSFQLKTTGKSDTAIFTQSQALFQALLDSDVRRPRMNFTLESFRVIAIDNLRGPFQLGGRDDKKQLTVVTNFGVEVVPAAG